MAPLEHRDDGLAPEDNTTTEKDVPLNYQETPRVNPSGLASERRTRREEDIRCELLCLALPGTS